MTRSFHCATVPTCPALRRHPTIETPYIRRTRGSPQHCLALQAPRCCSCKVKKLATNWSAIRGVRGPYSARVWNVWSQKTQRTQKRRPRYHRAKWSWLATEAELLANYRLKRTYPSPPNDGLHGFGSLIARPSRCHVMPSSKDDTTAPAFHSAYLQLGECHAQY